MAAIPLGKILLERAPRPSASILGQVFPYETLSCKKAYACLGPSNSSHELKQTIVACQTSRPKGQIALTLDVRFGSKADIGLAPADVRFTPKSRHCRGTIDVRFVPVADIGVQPGLPGGVVVEPIGE